jgi:polyisoprenoid-binding protein YceI
MFVCAASAARAQETLVRLDPAKTRVQFTLGATAHTVHGTFKLKTGQIRFDPATGNAAGEIVVDARSGDTENPRRDRKMHQEVLLSEKYGEIVFAPSHVQGAIATQSVSQVQVTGTMRLLGRDHEITLTFAVQPSTGNLFELNTRFSIPYLEWGLKNPSNFLLRVDKSVEVEVHATVEIIPAASSAH